jgi:ribonuclease-3
LTDVRPAALPDDLSGLQQRLRHVFSDVRLLQQALTHRSFGADHNERLEFLGDSVLNLAVARLLYERLAGRPEGDLSRVRANLVKQDTLHRLALGLGLPGLIRVGEGEARSGGHKRPSILARGPDWGGLPGCWLRSGAGAGLALV